MSAEVDLTKAILDARAAQLAIALTDGGGKSDEFEVAACTVGSERFGFPVRHLREIVPLPDVTRLPHTPPWVLGLAHVRGTLLCVIDLGRLCTVRGLSTPRHLAVVQAEQCAIGFTVDEVLACRPVSASLLEPESRDRGDHRAALGVTRDLLVVLDVPKLLASPELIVQ
jgi:purine-binding chemotaxis protein CheW